MLWIFRRIGRKRLESWFAGISGQGTRFWFPNGAVISAILFLFMFAYWGDYGLGDGAKTPIGHGKAVKQINGNDAYFENNQRNQVGIRKFTFDDRCLYAESDRSFDETNGHAGNFVVWDLRNDFWMLLSNREYQRLVETKGYPVPEIFEAFWDHYQRH